MSLYILENGSPQPSTLDEFNRWEETIPDSERSALGRRLAVDHVGDKTIVTLFLAAPVGWFGRRPQAFLTMAYGPSLQEERCYSSLRAALNGHRDEIRRCAKAVK